MKLLARERPCQCERLLIGQRGPQGDVALLGPCKLRHRALVDLEGRLFFADKSFNRAETLLREGLINRLLQLLASDGKIECGPSVGKACVFKALGCSLKSIEADQAGRIPKAALPARDTIFHSCSVGATA